ncbi:UNVERIFIED_CONTAM: hypothetical protein Sradi_7011200 [Sesamum radiatum]|uniref:Uncharacterized protein n=1 Tax=Sesamum radiatum TaxID=300843 RepID=A0AAW2JCD5_SESRA
MEECLHLKDEIKKRIRREYLKEYIDRNNRPREGNSRPPQERREREKRGNQPNQDNPSTARVIRVISEGPAGGDSARARKAALRAARNNANELSSLEVMMNEELQEKQEIIFGSQDLEKGINNAELAWANTPLTNFSGSVVKPVGEVMLPISLGSYPKRVTKMVKFLVVDTPSAYNVIFGRPSLNSFKAIASTYHLKLKFSTPNGIGEEVGDRRQARECYANSLKESKDRPNEVSSSGKAPTVSKEVTAAKGGKRDPLIAKKRGFPGYGLTKSSSAQILLHDTC